MQATAAASATAAPRLQVGRTFVSPGFDLLLIGGGLTYPLVLWLFWDGASAAAWIGLSIPVIALLVNQAHFAASTVRLYTKPGAFQSLPFLTMGLPLLTLLGVTAVLLFGGEAGRHLWALSITWSPYHYSAQAFGLAAMYCYRSGCMLSDRERAFLRAACLMTFFKAFLGGTGAGYGLGWLVPASWIAASPVAGGLFALAVPVLDVLIFAMPLALFAWLAWGPQPAAAPGEAPKPRRPGMPLVSLFVVLSNGMWFVVLDYRNAFVWATVFHGLQYLAIVAVFHARDRRRHAAGGRGALLPVAGFYAVCVVLGYALFQCWPLAYTALGFGGVESILMVLAAINVHHFVVDGFIWRLRRDANYRTVMATT